jgi:hypothetical protein
MANGRASGPRRIFPRRERRPAEGEPHAEGGRLSGRRIAALIGLVSTLIGVVLGGYQIVSGLRQSWAVERQIAALLYAGDRFAARDEFNAALGQYEQAAALDGDNVAVQRRILDLDARRLSHQAFVEEPGFDAALHRGLNERTRRWHVPAGAVDDYLARLYRFVALNPAAAQDPDMLLAEGLALKAGLRLGDARPVLDRALALSPDEPRLLAEAGLLRAYAALARRRPDLDAYAAALALVRRAAELRPDEPRYAYYLGRLLEEGGETPGDAAEAIRAFARAGAAPQETKETEKLAVRADFALLLRILRSVEPRELDEPPTPLRSRAGLSQTELRTFFEAALARTQPNWGSFADVDDPYVLLARLRYADGEPEKAWEALTQRGWRINGRDYHCANGVPKLRFAARLLEEGGYDEDALAAVRAGLQAAAEGCRD